ncbi:DUF805 domain-containing protein [Terricaulis silvestris]|uniref:Inner membrane protein YhaH n=1 Tax=Terricaulis silvestris TaxID=2686094 RepID=A0A6I6MKP9_9CAUL|nr:DUF805 domain-containing protein [Terricaulis silvestris]QGZ95925.1 Inner membrane protein YhaH [Terricaulis silvestris]
MADVFISYAREDRARAEQVARGLQALGLEAFWDTEIPPGQTWADYIEGKLTSCRAVVVLWSEHSTKSQWVREEARMGRDKSKLIPALIDGSQMPFGFGEVQAANLATWRGEPNHPEWTRFANAVHAAARDGAAAPQPAAPISPYRPPPIAPATPVYAAAPTGEAETLSPIGYVQKCFRFYFNGKGRARRAEYWWWILFTVALAFVASFIDVMAFGYNTYTSQPNNQVFNMIATLAVLSPSIAVTSRRFHDVGLSGWLVAAVFGVYLVAGMMMAAMMPLGAVLFGATILVSLVITVIPSRPGPNQYGPNPKGQ